MNVICCVAAVHPVLTHITYARSVLAAPCI
jgi:hypothetical protein